MQITLQIEVGTEGILTYADFRKALRYVSKYTRRYRGRTEEIEPGDDAYIRNESRDIIGSWEVEES